MFARFRRGWSLTKASLGVLRADKELAVLPVISLVVLLVTVGPLAAGGAVVTGITAGGDPGPMGTALVFLVYVVGYFVVIFFNAAVVSCASVRFEGGDPTLRDGLSHAWSRKGVILQWSLLAATVGMILRALRRRADGLVRLLLGGIGLAWNAATYFVVPVLVHEGTGPIDSLKRSGSIVRETWGEALAGEASTGLIFVLAGIGWIGLLLAVVFAAPVGPVVLAAVVLGVLGLAVIGAAAAAVDGILKAALYEYAETGEIPEAFQGAGVPERKDTVSDVPEGF